MHAADRDAQVVALLAEAGQLLAELRDALPALPASAQLEARRLIGELEGVITTASAALAVVTAGQEPPEG